VAERPQDRRLALTAAVALDFIAIHSFISLLTCAYARVIVPAQGGVTDPSDQALALLLQPTSGVGRLRATRRNPRPYRIEPRRAHLFDLFYQDQIR
jgi:hypothetical protein